MSTPAPGALDPNNPTQAQIDSYNAAYIASLSPGRLALFAGTFGLPGRALSLQERMQLAYQLSGSMKVDLLIDGVTYNNSPAMVTLNRYRDGYKVFSYIGEPNPDWTTAPPGQTLPGLPPYDPTGHTGVVSLANPAPYVPPTPVKPPITSLIGPWTGATTTELNLPGPAVKVWEPSIPTLVFAEAFPYTDPSGAKYLWHIMGNPLMNAEQPPGEGVWLGPE